MLKIEGNVNDDSSYEDCSDEDEKEEDDNLDKWTGKPGPSRLILEPTSLKKLVERNAFCPNCKSGLEMNFTTVTVASSVQLRCTNHILMMAIVRHQQNCHNLHTIIGKETTTML